MKKSITPYKTKCQTEEKFSTKSRNASIFPSKHVTYPTSIFEGLKKFKVEGKTPNKNEADKTWFISQFQWPDSKIQAKEKMNCIFFWFFMTISPERDLIDDITRTMNLGQTENTNYQYKHKNLR